MKKLAKFARTALGAAPLAAGVLLAASAANAATSYSTTFQGASFKVISLSSTEFTFDIKGGNALTGDWAGATNLGAFAFDNIGSLSGGTVIATLKNPATGQATTATGGGMNSSGCNGNGTGWICFNLSPNVGVAPDLLFDVKVSGATFNIGGSGPDLKIDWTKSSTGDTHVGSLYSASIPLSTVTPGVPEPATWAMMLVGFGGLGAMLRLRRRLAAVAA